MKSLYLLALAMMLTACQDFNFGKPTAILDLNVIAQAIGRDDVIKQNVQTANSRLNQQLEQIAKELQQQVEEKKTKLGDKPTKEDEQTFLNLVKQANAQLNQNKQLAVQKSRQVQSQLVIEFRDEVSKVAETIARANGYQSVISTGESLIWADDSIDITDEIIAVMRSSKYTNSQKTQTTDGTE